MNAAGIILAVLKLAGALFDYFQQRKWIAEGEAIQIAKASAEILRKSGYAKHALEEAESLSDTELDQRLRDFESGGRGDGK